MTSKGFFTTLALSAVLAGCGGNVSYPPTSNDAHVNGSRLRHGTAIYPNTIWVANTDSNPSALTGYIQGSGDQVALKIAGSNTGLYGPRSIAADNSNGRLYVANSSGSGAVPIEIFANDANGNVAPIDHIRNSYFTIYNDLALDPSGDLWVSSDNYDDDFSLLQEFAPGAHGAPNPIATISGSKTTLFQVTNIATDLSGNVYVVDIGSEEIAEFPAGSNGNVTPSRVISGSNTGFYLPYGIAVDASGYMYVADPHHPNLKIFGPNQNGNVSAHAIISGANTQLQTPVSVAVDQYGNIFVGDSTANAIYVFAPGSSGNVSPVRTITAGIHFPLGISVCKAVPPCETGTPQIPRGHHG